MYTHHSTRNKKEKERNCATFFFPLSGNKKDEEEERRYLGVTSTKTRQRNLLFMYRVSLYKFRTVILREQIRIFDLRHPVMVIPRGDPET